MSLTVADIVQIILFVFFGIITISSAIFIVRSKNVFYEAVSLAF